MKEPEKKKNIASEQTNLVIYEELEHLESETPDELLQKIGGAVAKSGHESLTQAQTNIQDIHSLTSTPTPSSIPTPDYHAEAEQALSEHHYQDAAEDFEKDGVKADLGNAAKAWDSAGNVDVVYGTAAENQQAVQAFSNAAQDYLKSGDYKSAAQEYISEAGQSINDAQKDYENAAQIYAQHGDHADAATAYTNAAGNAMDGSTAASDMNLAAKEYLKEGNTAQAISAFESTGRYYENAQQFNLAGESYDEAAQLNAQAGNNQASIGDYNEAASDFRSAGNYQSAEQAESHQNSVSGERDIASDLEAQAQNDTNILHAAQTYEQAAKEYALAGDSSDENSALILAANDYKTMAKTTTQGADQAWHQAGTDYAQANDNADAEKAFEHSAQIYANENNNFSAAQEYENAAKAYDATLDYADSAKAYEQASKYFATLSSSPSTTDTQNSNQALDKAGAELVSEAKSNVNSGDYTAAAQLFTNAANEFNKSGNLEEEAKSNANAGQAFNQAHDFTDAANSYSNAKNEFSTIGDSSKAQQAQQDEQTNSNLAASVNNLTQVEANAQSAISSGNYGEAARDFATAANTLESEGQNSQAAAELLQAAKQYAKAEEFSQAANVYENAAGIFTQANDYANAATAYDGAAKAYIDAGASLSQSNTAYTNEAMQYDKLAAAENNSGNTLAAAKSNLAAGMADDKAGNESKAENEYDNAALGFKNANDAADAALAYAKDAKEEMLMVQSSSAEALSGEFTASDAAKKYENAANEDMLAGNASDAANNLNKAAQIFQSISDTNDANVDLVKAANDLAQVNEATSGSHIAANGQQLAEAAALEAQAGDANRANDLYKEAASAFLASASSSSETPSAKGAAYENAANAFLHAGDKKDAALAFENAAGSYISANDYSDAASAYASAATNATSNEQAIQDLEKSGDAYSQSGNSQRAISAYSDIVSQFDQIESPNAKSYSNLARVESKLAAVDMNANNAAGAFQALDAEAAALLHSEPETNLAKVAGLYEQAAQVGNGIQIWVGPEDNQQLAQVNQLEMEKAARIWNEIASQDTTSNKAQDYANAAKDFAQANDIYNESASISAANASGYTGFVAEAQNIENKAEQLSSEGHANQAAQKYMQAAMYLNDSSANVQEEVSDLKKAASNYEKSADTSSYESAGNALVSAANLDTVKADQVSLEKQAASDLNKAASMQNELLMNSTNMSASFVDEIANQSVHYSIEAAAASEKIGDMLTAAKDLDQAAGAYQSGTAQGFQQNTLDAIEQNAAKAWDAVANTAQAAGNNTLAISAYESAAADGDFKDYANAASLLASDGNVQDLSKAASDYAKLTNAYTTQANIDNSAHNFAQGAQDYKNAASALSSEITLDTIVGKQKDEIIQLEQSEVVSLNQAGLADASAGNNAAAITDFNQAKQALAQVQSDVKGQLSTEQAAIQSAYDAHESGFDKDCAKVANGINDAIESSVSYINSHPVLKDILQYGVIPVLSAAAAAATGGASLEAEAGAEAAIEAAEEGATAGAEGALPAADSGVANLNSLEGDLPSLPESGPASPNFPISSQPALPESGSGLPNLDPAGEGQGSLPSSGSSSPNLINHDPGQGSLPSSGSGSPNFNPSNDPTPDPESNTNSPFGPEPTPDSFLGRFAKNLTWNLNSKAMGKLNEIFNKLGAEAKAEAESYLRNQLGAGPITMQAADDAINSLYDHIENNLEDSRLTPGSASSLIRQSAMMDASEAETDFTNHLNDSTNAMNIKSIVTLGDYLNNEADKVQNESTSIIIQGPPAEQSLMESWQAHDSQAASLLTESQIIDAEIKSAQAQETNDMNIAKTNVILGLAEAQATGNTTEAKAHLDLAAKIYRAEGDSADAEAVENEERNMT